MRDKGTLALLGAFPESRNLSGCKIGNKNDHIKIVRDFGYTDLTPRTMKGKTKDDFSDSLEDLAEATYSYFNSENNTDYDQWHKDTCEKFVNNMPGPDQPGKAQKILNMMMKYLFCLDDAKESRYAVKFADCHMPIDTYVIDWFCNTVAEKGTISVIRDIKWSKLEYGEKDKEFTYMWFQRKIRDYLNNPEKNKKYRGKDQKPLTPLEAEFYIWPEQKFIKAYKSMKVLEVFAENYPGYRDGDLEEMCDDLMKKLSEFKKKRNTRAL